MEKVTKQSAEKKTIEVDYTDSLPSSVTVSSGTVSAIRLDTGATDNTVLTSTTATVSSPYARFQLTAGTNGVTYRVELTTTLSNGDILNNVFKVVVRDE